MIPQLSSKKTKNQKKRINKLKKKNLFQPRIQLSNEEKKEEVNNVIVKEFVKSSINLLGYCMSINPRLDRLYDKFIKGKDNLVLGSGYSASVIKIGDHVRRKLKITNLIPISPEDVSYDLKVHIHLKNTVLPNSLLVKVLSVDEKNGKIELEYGGVQLDKFLGTTNINYYLLKSLLQNICLQLLELNHLGLFHRDIKIDNIVVTRIQKGTYIFRLCDFGFCSFNLDGTKPLRSKNVNSPPENILTWRSDIFSLGIIIRNLMNNSVKADVPKDDLNKILKAKFLEIYDIVDRMLESDPKIRPDYKTIIVNLTNPEISDPSMISIDMGYEDIDTYDNEL